MPDDDAIPTSPGVNRCPDCGCHPHRHHEPSRDKDCPRCGCPTMRVAKAERDASVASDHFAAGRNTSPGFA